MSALEPHFIFFMDDSGTRTACKPGDELPMEPHIFSFSLGGIIVPSEAVPEISEAVRAFCEKWKVPSLHGSKIRGKRGKFSFLDKDAEVEKQFLSELEQIILDDRITAHACVVCRPGYRDRYHDKYPHATRWDMSRTAFDISVERAAKYARSLERRLTVVYERTGYTEDRLLEGYFERLSTLGTEFNATNSSPHQPLTSNELANTLLSIWPDGKSNPMLQLADLVLHPIMVRPTHRPNHAFEQMQSNGQLLDCRSSDTTIAIKYSCYDEPYQTWEDPKKHKRDPKVP